MTVRRKLSYAGFSPPLKIFMGQEEPTGMGQEEPVKSSQGFAPDPVSLSLSICLPNPPEVQAH